MGNASNGTYEIEKVIESYVVYSEVFRMRNVCCVCKNVHFGAKLKNPDKILPEIVNVLRWGLAHN